MTTQSKIDYESLTQEAMRGVVRAVLNQIRDDGLPGDHHFYISFDTTAENVGVSKRLKAKYPQEMTIVLQHRFWDLIVSDERFEVKLTFDGIPERLVVPFKAIKVFFDPSVRYGLQFEEAGFTSEAIDESIATHNALIDPAQDEQADDDTVQTLQPARKLHAETSTDAFDGEAADTDETVTPELETADKDATPPHADSDEETPAAGAEIVSLDAFRKK